GVAAGKLRRYWDLQNLSDPLRVAQGTLESYHVVRRFKPQLAFAAGGFAAVPPMFAARVFARAKTLIHQQDVQPGLANRLLVPLANRITVSLDSSLAHFPRARSTVTGNPVRDEILRADPRVAFERLGLEADVPLPGSHQWASAQAFARLGAIEVADQAALTADRLAERVLSLLDDEPRRVEMSRALAASMLRNAAAHIAHELLALQAS